MREACESCRTLEAIDDIHAPAAYRQHLAAVLSRRALEKAHARVPNRAHAAKRMNAECMSEKRNIALTVNGKRYERRRSRCA